MRRLAAASPVALLLLSLGCGDDEPSKVDDAAVSKPDGAVTDSSSPVGEQRFDATIPATNDAGQTSNDAASDTTTADAAPTDAGDFDAFADPAPDSGIIIVEGDAGTDWILTQQCPASSETEPCAVCEDKSCCQTYGRYAANAEARAFRTCYEPCLKAGTPGVSCRKKCDTEHPNGTADFAVRAACIETFCPTECFDQAVTACSTCRKEQCGSQLIAAAATEEGFLVQGCTDACAGNATCQQACVTEYSQGAGLVLLAGDCVKAKCPACAQP